MTLYQVMRMKILKNIAFIAISGIVVLLSKFFFEHSTYAFIASGATTLSIVALFVIVMRIFVNMTLSESREIERTIFTPFWFNKNTSVSYAEFIMFRRATTILTGNSYTDERLKKNLGLVGQDCIDFDKLNEAVKSADDRHNDITMCIKYEHLLNHVRQQYIKMFGLTYYVKNKTNKEGLSIDEMDLLITKIISNQYGIDFYNLIKNNSTPLDQCGSMVINRVNKEFDFYCKNCNNDTLDLNQKSKVHDALVVDKKSKEFI